MPCQHSLDRLIANNLRNPCVPVLDMCIGKLLRAVQTLWKNDATGEGSLDLYHVDRSRKIVNGLCIVRSQVIH